MARFSLDSMYRELQHSPIGTQFRGPGGREWVKTPFGLRLVGPKETAREVLARSGVNLGSGSQRAYYF